MRQEERKRRYAVVTVVCALALVASMGVPSMAASWAFAGDEGDQVLLEVNDVIVDEGTLLGEEDPKEGAFVDEEDSEASEVSVDTRDATDDKSEGTSAEWAMNTPADGNAESENGTFPEGAGVYEDLGAMGESSSDEEKGDEALADEIDDNSHIRTVYFGGNEVSSFEIGCAEKIPLDRIPSLDTSTIEVMGRQVTGVFVGWTRCKVVDGRPQWLEDSRLSLVKGAQGIFSSTSNRTGLSSEDIAKSDFGCVDGGDPNYNDIAFQPIYVAPLTRFELHPCTPVIENGVLADAEFDMYDATAVIWAPAETPVTLDMARQATLQAFAGTDAPFARDPYQYVGWHFASHRGLRPARPAALAFPSNHSADIYVLFSENPEAYQDLESNSDDPEVPGNSDAEDGSFIVSPNGTGIAVKGDIGGSNVPEGSNVAVYVDPVVDGAAHDRLIAVVNDGDLAGIFEINLYVDGVLIHDGFGELEISFPVENADGHWVTVYHLHEDGAITSERVVARNGKVTIKVTDLSTFALEVGEAYAEASSTQVEGSTSKVARVEGAVLAQTGDMVLWIPVVLAALVSCIFGAFAWMRVRRARGRHIR